MHETPSEPASVDMSASEHDNLETIRAVENRFTTPFNVAYLKPLAELLSLDPSPEHATTLQVAYRIQYTKSLDRFTNQFIGTHSDRTRRNVPLRLKEYLLNHYGNVEELDYCGNCHQVDDEEVFIDPNPKTGKNKRSSLLLHPDNCTPCTIKNITSYDDLDECLTQCNCVQSHLDELFKGKPSLFKKYVEAPYDSALSKILSRVPIWHTFFETLAQEKKPTKAQLRQQESKKNYDKISTIKIISSSIFINHYQD